MDGFKIMNLNYQIRLGQNLDTTKINAKLEEGVLTVNHPSFSKSNRQKNKN